MKKQIDQPIPQGKYLPAVRHADLIYTSGMTPRKSGQLKYEGKIKASVPMEEYRGAVELATLNTINAAKACLEKDENIVQALQLNVFLNAEEGFTAHAKMADFASEFLIKEFGPHCIGSRAAIGVATLPSNAPVEITVIFKLARC